MAREYRDDENLLTPEDVLERERAFEQEEKEDQADALSHLYANDEGGDNDIDEADEELPEGDARLTELLTPIDRRSHTVMPVVQGPTDTVHHTIEQGASRIRHRVAAALISILLLFGIGLGAGMFKNHLESEAETAALIEENERRAAEAKAEQEKAEAEAEEARVQEEAHAARPIKFIVSATGYDSLATRIPLVVTGVDLDGNEVKTEGFINSEGEGLSLSPGEYTVSIPASPILSTGLMYQLPNTTYSFRVPQNSKDVINVDQAIVLIPLTMADINEDMVNNAYNWGMKDTQMSSVVEANIGPARQYLEEAKQRQAEAERHQQLVAQRAPIAQSFAASYFTNVGFPDSEDDSKVSVITNWTSVAAQYIAAGSAASNKLSGGNGARYSYATHVNTVAVDDETVTLDVNVITGDEVKVGWTLNESSKRITCVFDSNNKITDFYIS